MKFYPLYKTAITEAMSSVRSSMSYVHGSIPMRSFTAPRKRCLQPRYFKCTAVDLQYYPQTVDMRSEEP